MGYMSAFSGGVIGVCKSGAQTQFPFRLGWAEVRE